MTDASDFPDTGEDATVTYQSERSGNTVERTGTVAAVTSDAPDDGVEWQATVRVDREPMKETLVVVEQQRLADAPNAFTVTVSPDSMEREEHSDGTTYVLTNSVDRSLYLGTVESVEAASEVSA